MLLSDDVWKTAGSLHSQKRKTLVASKTSHTTLRKLSHNAFPNPNIRDTTVGGLHCFDKRGDSIFPYHKTEVLTPKTDYST